MQQINFQQHLVRTDDTELSADQIALITAVVFGALLLLAAMVSVWNSVLSNKLDTAKTEQQRLSQQMDGLTQSLASNGQQQIAAMKQQLRERKAMLASLRADQSKERIAFSARLQGLGRQAVEGLWLNQIAIDETGSALNLGGKTVKAELVPRYLRALSNDEVFKGLRFDVMKISGAEIQEKATPLSFEVLALRDGSLNDRGLGNDAMIDTGTGN